MKRSCILLFILVGTGVLTGWASGGQEKGVGLGAITEQVQIDFWYSIGATQAAPLEKILRDWNASNPMISVTGIYQGGYAATHDKLLTAWVAGNPPIMSQIDQCFAGVFVNNGAVLSLEGFIKGDKSFDLKDFNPYILKGGTYHGEIYGLPLNISTPILYINRDLFRRAGLNPDKNLDTWEQAYAYSAKMTDPSSSIYGFRLYSSDWIYHSLLKQFGSDLFSPDDKKAIFNNKEGKEAVAFWKKMCDEKVATYQAGSAANAMDFNGQIGMVVRSTGSLQAYKDNAKIDYGTLPFTFGKHKAVSLGGANIYLFGKSTPQKQRAAWEVLKFMTNTENLVHFAVNTGYMAARKSALASPELQKILTADPRYRTTYDQLVYSFPAPKVSSFSQIDDIFHSALDRILLKGESVDILDEAAAKVQGLLD
ncbi:MAG: hypothetical protein A2Y63_06610 [Candidatus Riflebacteria bacterium RBG_13_59_9]|nr:MAG: hypothetical protein A2Y63_06610 [Candidatus Riflebacteria bacterium RBG_13_59_9]